MKPKLATFTVKFNKESTHWINVVLHPNRTAMRRFLRTQARYNALNSNAICWQGSKPTDDHCIAEIHFCRDYLTIDTITHECTHAAFHRCVLIGIPYEHKQFQEWLADDAGKLTDTIMALFLKHHVPVRLDVVGLRII